MVVVMMMMMLVVMMSSEQQLKTEAAVKCVAALPHYDNPPQEKLHELPGFEEQEEIHWGAVLPPLSVYMRRTWEHCGSLYPPCLLFWGSGFSVGKITGSGSRQSGRGLQTWRRASSLHMLERLFVLYNRTSSKMVAQPSKMNLSSPNVHPGRRLEP